MAKIQSVKDIIVRRTDRLYAMMYNEILCWSSKKNADHFTGKAAAKRGLPGLHHFTVEFVDLNSKRKRGK